MRKVQGMCKIVLLVFIILGGSAVWWFWDKIKAGFKRVVGRLDGFFKKR